MSFHEQGCWELQKLLENKKVHRESKLLLVQGLRGHAVAASLHKYANFVVQRMVEELQASDVSFVAEEINGSEDSVLRVAKNLCGCRVLLRLVEHGDSRPEVAALISTVLDNVREISRQKYGHFVVEMILEHGRPEQKQRVAIACLEDVLAFARDGYAGYVVKSILTYGSDQDRHAVLEGLFAGGPDGLVSLTRDNSVQSGTEIIEELFVQARERTEQALRQGVEELKKSKHGRRLVRNYRLEDGQAEQGK